jgi:predicted GNAT family acetyltransferase
LYILRDSNCAVIQGVVTLPEYRRRGLCTGLLRAAIADFRKSWPNMPLFLEAEDENAIRIYERAGFTRIHAPREWIASKPLP